MENKSKVLFRRKMYDRMLDWKRQRNGQSAFQI